MKGVPSGALPETTDVLVVGAGPTGLTAGLRLAMSGVDAVVVDRLPARDESSRAVVLHPRSLETFDGLGVGDRLVQRGLKVRKFRIYDRDRLLLGLDLDDLRDLPTDFPYALTLPQNETEAILEERLREVGGRLCRGVAVAGLLQEASGVVAFAADGRRVRAKFLLAADGSRSAMRKAAGIPFEGGDPEPFALADVELENSPAHPEARIFLSRDGLAVVAPLPGRKHRLVASVFGTSGDPDAECLQRLLDARGPSRSPLRISEIHWSGVFEAELGIAARFRAGRVVLAGDAAHGHNPAAAQGFNIGVEDAAFLAGLMPQALGGNPDVLDLYERRRQQVTKDVARFAQRVAGFASVRKGFARSVRNRAFRTLDRLPVLKNSLARRITLFR